MNKVEVYDTLVNRITIMPDSLASSLLKYNGIKQNEKGEVIAGRYVLAENLDIEGSGVDSIVVVDHMTGEQTVRTFKVEGKQVIVEKITEEKPTKDEAVEAIEMSDTEPVKKTRGRKKKV